MLYLAIPAHNEVATIGVLLWRLRTVLAEFPREYEVVVYDDASNDETADVAEQYAHAMPVTVLRGKTSVGYAGAVDALARHISGLTRYPRRDAMLLLQGDFTDPPGIVPEFARRFEGGADLVVGERTAVVDAPVPVRRLFTAAGWALRPFVRVAGVRDLTGSMRLVRISALRDLLRTAGDAPVCAGDSWTANADLLLRLMPHARRVETIPLEPTYGVRTRETRRVTVRDALAALRWGWRARGRRAEPSSTPESSTESAPRSARGASARRRDEPEVTVDKLRERSKERERLRGDTEVTAPRSRRDGRPERERSSSRPHDSRATEARANESTRDDTRNDIKREEPRREEARRPIERTERSDRPERGERPERAERPERGTRKEAPKPGRGNAAPGRGRSAPIESDDSLLLDDPFAGRSSRASSRPTVTPPTPPVSNDVAVDVPTVPSVPSHSSPSAAQSPNAMGRVADNNDVDDATDETLNDDLTADTLADDTMDAATPDARERKRRRNRRSRRRRSKNRPESGEGAEVESGASADTETAAARVPDASNDRESDVDGDDDEAGADEGADDGADAGADVSASARSARAKRRGRRGRRGGSRRSRGRGRDGEEGSADASSGGPPDAPSNDRPSADRPSDGGSTDNAT